MFDAARARFRIGLTALLAASVAGVASPTAMSQDAAKDWPTKPVRVVVGFAVGGATDATMRAFGDRLTKSLGQPFVIDNRGGASGTLGAEAVAKSQPDGYTFLVTASQTLVIVPHLRKVAYDPFKDFKPVTQFADSTLLIAVHPSLLANSIEELVAYGKANPGKLIWGTAGIGSYAHILMEGFKARAGIDILHVPYRGGSDSLPDFLAGVFHIHADPNTVPHVHTGKARLLAVVDRERRPDFSNVRLLREIYPDLDFAVWFGMLAPAGTPDPIIAKLAGAMNDAARDPDVRDIVFKVGSSANPGTTAEMAELIKKDHARFADLIRNNNIKAD